MTIFDVLRYPMSAAPKHTEILAMPTQIRYKWEDYCTSRFDDTNSFITNEEVHRVITRYLLEYESP